MGHLERQISHVCAPERNVYADIASSTSYGAITAVATTSVTNVSNISAGTRSKDPLTDAYAMTLKVALPASAKNQAKNQVAERPPIVMKRIQR